MKKTILFFSILFLSRISTFAQSEQWQKELLSLVNDLREEGCKCGRKNYSAETPLIWNEKLTAAAINHATDMSKKKYFDHRSRNGRTFGDRIDAVGYKWEYCGENIAKGQKTAREVFEDWKKSPLHCKNMMNKDFKEMGAAKINEYWNEEFGTQQK